MRIPRNLRDAALQRTMFQPRNAVASMPNLNSGILNVSANNQQYGGTADDIAKIIGTDIFKNTNLNKVTQKDVKTLATTNEEEVPDHLKAAFDNNPLASQTLGGIATIMGSTNKLVKLYEDQQKGLVKTPAEAKKRVKEFFPSLQTKETPVWADAAVGAGLALIESGGDIGAGLRGGIEEAKKTKATKAKRDFAIDQMAFGVYNEDVKARTNIQTNLAKLSVEQDKNALNYSAKIAKVLQDNYKLDADKTGKVVTEINSVLNSYPEKHNNAIRSLVAKKLPDIAQQPIENISRLIATVVNDELGSVLSKDADAANFEKQSFTFTDENSFNYYKGLFSEHPLFQNAKFEEGREYKIDLSVDKRNANDQDKLIKSSTLLSFSKALGKSDSFTTLLNNRSALNDQISFMPDGLSKTEASKQLALIDQRILKLTKDDPKQMYMITPAGVVIAGDGENVQGAFNAAEISAMMPKYNAKKAGFARLAGLGYNALVLLETMDPDGTQLSAGLFSKLARGWTGLQSQTNSFKSIFSSAHPDQGGKYINGALDNFSSFYSSTERTPSGKKAGDVFKIFDEVIGDNRAMRSILTDMAFALASTRETGKLTDKDIAASLETIGGRDLVENKLLPTKRDLIVGLNTALNNTNMQIGSEANIMFEPARNRKKKQEGENADVSNLVWNPLSVVKNNPIFNQDQGNWRNQIQDNKGTLSFNQELIVQDAKEKLATRQGIKATLSNNTGVPQDVIDSSFETYKIIEDKFQESNDRQMREDGIKRLVNELRNRGYDKDIIRSIFNTFKELE